MIAEIQTGKLNGDSVRSLPIKALPTSANGWPPRPFQIVSLLDMVEFPLDQFIGLYIWLGTTVNTLRDRTDKSVSEQEKAAILANVAAIESIGQLCDIDLSYFTARSVEKINNPDYLLLPLHESLSQLRAGWSNELRKQKFLFMPLGDVAYYDQQELFGSEVKEKFSKANEEITIAGDCYATGNYTASVFHLMRAVEIAARYMIRKLDASKHLFNTKGVSVPVELCDWHTLIQAMEKGLTDLSPGISTSKYKKQKHEHFSHALATFRHFKNAWRNHVSHARELYKPGKAKDIMDNTRQFMQHLASGF